MRRARYWLLWGALLAAAASLVVWLVTHETLPATIRIATAQPGGLYHELGVQLGEALEARTGTPVQVVATQGSRENLELLADGRVDLAILQLGPTSPELDVVALAPLFEDLIHVVARKDRGISEVAALAGKAILIGADGSGMHATAEVVLEHYDVDAGSLEDPRYFTALLEDATLDGAIVTAGIGNRDLERVLRSGAFELVAIDQAPAISTRHPLLMPRTLERGVYRGVPPIPAEPTPTLGTPAVLALRAGASDVLAVEVLEALYAGDLQRDFPGLKPREEAGAWSAYPRHAAARAYFDPYEGLGVLANLFEALAALKELLFALGAGLYVLISWWRSIERREREAELAVEKEHLDQLIDATVRIERAQLHEYDVRALEQHRDDVVEIKLRALAELTGEEVRGDRMFSILLQQIEFVCRSIEAKLSRVALTPESKDPSD